MRADAPATKAAEDYLRSLCARFSGQLWPVGETSFVEARLGQPDSLVARARRRGLIDDAVATKLVDQYTDQESFLSFIDRDLIRPAKQLALHSLGPQARIVEDVPVGCLPLPVWSFDACVGLAPSGAPFIALDLGLSLVLHLLMQFSPELSEALQDGDVNRGSRALLGISELALFLATADISHLRKVSEYHPLRMDTTAEISRIWLQAWILLHEYQHILLGQTQPHPTATPFRLSSNLSVDLLSVGQRREIEADCQALLCLTGIDRRDPYLRHSVSVLASLLYLLDMVRHARIKAGDPPTGISHPTPMTRWDGLKTVFLNEAPKRAELAAYINGIDEYFRDICNGWLTSLEVTKVDHEENG